MARSSGAARSIAASLRASAGVSRTWAAARPRVLPDGPLSLARPPSTSSSSAEHPLWCRVRSASGAARGGSSAAAPPLLTSLPAAAPQRGRRSSADRHRRGQKRTLFIGTERTPNEDSLKFKPDAPVLPEGTPTLEYLSHDETASSSPLARSLFLIEGVRGVMYGRDFITVTKDPDTPWQLLRPDVLGAIRDHFSTGEPVVLLDADGRTMHPRAQSDTAVRPEDSETVALIKELLETRVRPAIQEDGGDIEYRGFDNGVVKLRLRG
ncbi:MAG: scaffold protein Nfu/NifU N terminal-domain-containing protein, partial [Olpidium bornovanus]